MWRYAPLALILCALVASPSAAAAPPTSPRRSAPSDAAVVREATERLRAAPEDSIALWRRAEALRRLGRADLALADCEAMIARHPDSAYAVRAKRALPLLLARLGLDREAAEADEALLEERLVDPVVTLPRLAVTYARLGESKAVLEVVARLREIDPLRAEVDREVAWVEADAIDRLRPRRAGASAMLEFARHFPDDRRRGEAIVRAARAEADLGHTERALELARQALDGALPPAAVEGVRVARAELLERLGRTHAANEDLVAALETSRDAALIEIAVGRHADLTQQSRGTEAALVRLAELAASRRPEVADAARRRLPALLDGLAARRAIEPERAAFAVELVRRVDPEIEPPAALRLAAARLWESVGDIERAARLTGTTAAGLPPASPAAQDPDPAQLALRRGDARALDGEWETACRDFEVARAGAGVGPLAEAQAGWLELRLAECEIRRHETGAARRRLGRLLASEPGEPVATTARLLAARVPAPALPALQRASTQ